MSLKESQVINGTHGEVWFEDEKLYEQKGLQAKINFTKEDVQLAGKMAVGKKVVGWEGTGTLRIHKVNTTIQKRLIDLVKRGKSVSFTIVSKLADPDSVGAERVVLRDVMFDDLTLADFEPKKMLEVELPFTFTDFDYLDTI